MKPSDKKNTRQTEFSQHAVDPLLTKIIENATFHEINTPIIFRTRVFWGSGTVISEFQFLDLTSKMADIGEISKALETLKEKTYNDSSIRKSQTKNLSFDFIHFKDITLHSHGEQKPVKFALLRERIDTVEGIAIGTMMRASIIRKYKMPSLSDRAIALSERLMANYTKSAKKKFKK